MITSTLYLVATPIGNLEDISARALRVLREVHLIAAEDTRRTRKLLTHFAITTHLISYHEHSSEARRDLLIEALGVSDIALVSDAGTPAISDPGHDLVRAAIAAGHKVVPIPGPTAAISALIASGLPTERFTFLGFLPRKASERRALLEEVRSIPHTLILYEAPHRLLACLDDLLATLGNRPISLARELTKVHEDIQRGLAADLRASYGEGRSPRGEYVIVVSGAADEGQMPYMRSSSRRAGRPRVTLDSGGQGSQEAAGELAEAGARQLLVSLLTSGSGTRAAAAEAARMTGISRRDAYRLALELSAEAAETGES
jgi:16S rRNA (cytidine1402-2'-O)-methyltransferase